MGDRRWQSRGDRRDSGSIPYGAWVALLSIAEWCVVRIYSLSVWALKLAFPYLLSCASK